MAGLLSGVLPYIYSQSDRLKRNVNGLLSDPMGTMQQTAGGLLDSHRGQTNLLAQAFADPSQPFRVTDAGAMQQAAENMLAGPLGIAPAGMVVGPTGSIAHKVTTLRGEKVPAPTTFFRGETPGADRVLTNDANWDRALFAADNPAAALLYGQNVTQIKAKPGANILYEGTKEFNSVMKGYGNKGSMLDWASEATDRAKKAGFDAVWFKRQSDLGTAVLDRSRFDISGELLNNTGGLR